MTSTEVATDPETHLPGEICEIDLQDFVEQGLADLGDLIEELHLCDIGYAASWGNPTSNCAAEVVTPTFAMRSYCWCDETGAHAMGCPPNFEHFASGFAVTWYKYLVRRGRQNRLLTTGEWAQIFAECSQALAGFSVPAA